ncbi:hypothetical protein D5086_031369 [Populus alba]|uniref:Uncharacterized protein n=3 Tax=Populus TaxID=3689 RepID=A0ACC4AJ13_POPAL|nr:AIG2-like protein D [Populus alba]TKS04916.1 avirulence-responsive family protein [Populus alba]
MAMVGGNQVHNVFVYGSLLADDVVRALLSRIPQSSPAILNGHHRFSIKGRVYPAILPVENKKVTGKVLQGITDLELYILDEFEDVEYERVAVDVSLMDSSNKSQAFAYVWSDKNDPNLYGEWDFEEWKRTQMSDFAKMAAEFRKDLELPESKTRIATYESYYQQDGSDSPLAP